MADTTDNGGFPEDDDLFGGDNRNSNREQKGESLEDVLREGSGGDREDRSIANIHTGSKTDHKSVNMAAPPEGAPPPETPEVIPEEYTPGDPPPPIDPIDVDQQAGGDYIPEERPIDFELRDGQFREDTQFAEEDREEEIVERRVGDDISDDPEELLARPTSASEPTLPPGFDDNPETPFAKNSVLDEDDLSNGSDGSGARSVTQPLIIDFGDDGAGGVRLEVPQALRQMEIGPDGSVLNINVNEDGSQITAFDSEGSPVFSVTLNSGADGYSYTFELQGSVNHGDLDQVDLPIGITVTDSDGDAASGEFKVGIVDDEPVARDDELQSLEEGGGTVGSENGADNLLDNDTLGADGALIFQFTYTDENGEEQIARAGETVDTENGTLTVEADGSWSFEADPNVAHTDGEPVLDGFTYSIVDADGDTSAATQNIQITDDGPTVNLGDGPNGGASATLFEKDISGNDASVSNSLGIDFGADGEGSVALTIPQELEDMGLAADGQAVTYALADDGQSITASAGGETVFTMSITEGDNGEYGYTFELEGNLDHPDAGSDILSNLPFEVEVIDGDGSKATAEININVVDDQPEAVGEVTLRLEEGGNTVGSDNGGSNLLANDDVGADGGEITSFTYTDENGAEQSADAGATVDTENGSLTVNADGSWSFESDPNADHSGGEIVVDKFTYTLTDGDGDTSSAVQRIEITDDGPSIPPKAPPPGDGDGDNPDLGRADLIVDEDNMGAAVSQDIEVDFGADGFGSAALSVPSELTDMNLTSGGEAITYVVSDDGQTLTASANGETVFTVDLDADPATGELSYSVTLEGAVDHPESGASDDLLSNLPIGLTVTDGDGTQATSTLEIGIIDDTPTAENDGTVTLDEGGDTLNVTATDGLLANDDVGADGGEITSFTYTDENGAEQSAVAGATVDTENGSLTVNADGSWSFESDPNADHSGGDTVADGFTYTITDGDGDTATATQAIEITDDGPSIPPKAPPPGDGDGDNPDLGRADLIVDEDNMGAAVSQDIEVDFGADGFGSAALSVPSELTDMNLTSGGETITYVVSDDGQTVTASANGETVFTVDLDADPATGELSYSVTLEGAVDHPESGASDDLLSNLPIGLTVTDGDGTQATSTLEIGIIDDTPTAENDGTVTLDEGGDTLSVSATDGLLSNDDVGADGGEITSFTYTDENGAEQSADAGATVDTENGSLTVNADGSWSFESDPNADHSGGDIVADGFTYTITDGDGDTATATQDIQLTDDGPSIPPKAPPPGDGDGDNPDLGRADLIVDEDNMGAAVSQDIEVDFGADGFGSAALSVPSELTDMNLTSGGETITYAVSEDGQSVTASANGETVFTVDLDADPATGELSYSVTLEGAVDHPESGTSDDLLSNLPIGLTVTDGDGTQATSTLEIGIIDDTPTAENDGTVTLDEGGDTLNVSATDGLLSNDDVGADGGAITSFTYTDENGAEQSAVAGATVDTENGSLTVNADGSWSFESDPNADHSGGDTVADGFTYTITDGDGDTATATQAIEITDDGPQIGPPPGTGGDGEPNVEGYAVTVDEDDLADGAADAGQGLNIDFGADGEGSVGLAVPQELEDMNITSDGQAVTFTVSEDGQSVIGTTPNGNPVLTISLEENNGQYSYGVELHGNVDHGGDSDDVLSDLPVTLTVTDGDGDTASATLTVNVIDDAPVAVDDGEYNLTDGNEVIGTDSGSENLLANDDLGADDATITSFTYTDENGVQQSADAGSTVDTEQGTLTVNGDGTWSFESDDLIESADGTAVSDNFTYTITDGDGDTSSATVEINVSDGTAQPPQLVTGDGIGYEDNAIALDIDASAADSDGSESLSITISGVPDGASLSAGTDNGDGSWSLEESDLTGLTVTPPTDSDIDFDLNVSVTSTEVATGETSTVDSTFTVEVDAIADTTTVSASVEAQLVPASDSDGLSDVTVTNEGRESASYNNTYGYYIKDDDGNPTEGGIVFANTKEGVGDSITIEDVDSDNIGFFVIPNGDARNDDLNNGDAVTFEQDESGEWHVVGPDGDRLVGTGDPALFSDSNLNENDFEYVQDNDVRGNQNWEDIDGGGDRDFNDVNMNIVTAPNEGNEEAHCEVTVNVDATFGDYTDGSEQHFVVVQVPEGWEPQGDYVTVDSADYGDGTFIAIPVDAADLQENGGSISVPVTFETPVPDADGSIDVNVFAVAKEVNIDGTVGDGEITLDNNNTMSQATVVVEKKDLVAEDPNLVAGDAEGYEDKAIPLNIDVSLADTDGSESLSITISDVPDGASLSAGTDNGDGTWTLEDGDLDGLTVMPPTDSDIDFDLNVSVTSTESGSGDTSTVETTVTVEVDAVADTTTVSASVDAKIVQPDGPETEGGVIDTHNFGDTDSGFRVVGRDIDGEVDADNIVTSGGSMGVGGAAVGSVVPNQIGHNPETGEAEGIIVEFDNEVSEVSFSVSRLFENEGDNRGDASGDEQGKVILYRDGEVVGEVDFTAQGGNTGSFTVQADDGGSFDAIEFTATEYSEGDGTQTGDSSDYFVDQISFTHAEPPVGEQEPHCEITVNVDATFGDYTDGSENHFVVVQVPEGWDPQGDYVEVDNSNYGEGNFIAIQVDPVDLQDNDGAISVPVTFQAPVPDADGSVDVNVFAVAQEVNIDGTVGDGEITLDNNNTMSQATVVVEKKDMVADDPDLKVEDSAGYEDNAIPLSIDASLTDTDGSESLAITITDVPAGATLSAGTDNGDGTWTLEESDLEGLTVTPPTDSDVDFDLSVSVTSTEANSGDTSTVEASITVEVDAVADQTTVAGSTETEVGDNTITVNLNATFGDYEDASESHFALVEIPEGWEAPQGATVVDGGEMDGLPDKQFIQIEVSNTELEANDGSAQVSVDFVAPDDQASGDINFDVFSGAVETPSDSGEITLDNNTSFAGATVTANYQDGAPTVEAGEVLLSENDLGDGSTSVTGDINIDFGADGAGSVTMAVPAEMQDMGLTSGGEDVTFEVSEDGQTIVGSTPDGSPVMTITLNEDGGDYSYSVELQGPLDHGGDSGELINDIPVTLNVVDGNGESAEATINIDVADAVPEAVNDGVFNVQDGGNTIGTDGGQDNLLSNDDLGADGAEITSFTFTDENGEIQAADAGSTVDTEQGTLTVNADGTWAFESDDLMESPDGNPVMDNFSYTITDGDGDTSSATVRINVSDGTAQPPELVVGDGEGYEDNAIALNINATLSDTDGSESLSITIAGVPDGASLSAGTDNGDGTWSLEEDDLNGLTVTPPADSDVDFDLSVAVTSTETSTGETSTVENTFTVAVDAVADEVGVSAEISAKVIPGEPAGDPETVEITADNYAESDAGFTVQARTLDSEGNLSEPSTDSISIKSEGSPTGFGVKGDVSNGADSEIGFEDGKSEQVVVNFDEDISSADISIAWQNPNEDCRVTLYRDGEPVGEVVIEGGTDRVDALGTFTADDGGSFDQIVFEATGVNSDFLVNSIEFEVTPPPSDPVCEVEVDVTATFGDYTDGSEEHFVFVEVPDGMTPTDEDTITVEGNAENGLPAGQTFVKVPVDTADIEDGNGTVTVPVSFTGPVPSEDGTMNVQVFAAAIETNLDGTELTTDNNMTLTGTSVELEKTDMVVEDPNLVTADAEGYEDNAIPVNIDASLSDTDGSETMSITISGVPEGASLSAGTDNGDGTWSLEEGDLNGLSVTPPTDSDVDFDLSVAVTSTEISTGETSTVDSTFTVEVDAVADTTSVSASVDATLVEGDPVSDGLSDVTVTNEGMESASYHNTYGYYIKDEDGNPQSGGIVFADTKDDVGDSFTIEDVDADNIGFFVIPNGDNKNDSLSNGDEVTFEQDESGNWHVVDAGGERLVGAKDPVLFSDPELNENNFDHTTDNAVDGNQNWEDIKGGGDNDFNDVNMDVVITPNEPVATDPHCEVTVTVDASFGDYSDGSETHFVVVEVPEGWDPQGEYVEVDSSAYGDGTFIAVPVDAADLQNNDGSVSVPVTFEVPVSEAGDDVHVNVFAVAKETNLDGEELTLDNNTSMSQAIVTVDGKDLTAEPPEVVAADAEGYEDNAIPLSIDANLTDTDGSESLSITISGVPEGASLSAGADNGDGTWTLEEGDLEGLTVTPPTDSDVDFDLGVAVTSTEATTGDTSTVETSFTVEVDAVADEVGVSAEISAAIIPGEDSGETESVEITADNYAEGDAGFTVQARTLDSEGNLSEPSTDSISVKSEGSPTGFGVKGDVSNGADSEIGFEDGKSEQVVVNFDEDVSSADISIAWQNPNEDCRITLYRDGEPVGEVVVEGGTDRVDALGTFTADDGGSFDQIVFEATGVDSDFLVNSIEFEVAVPAEPVCEVEVDVTATFGDYTDGSEEHFVFVEVPAGMTPTNEDAITVEGDANNGLPSGQTFVKVPVDAADIEDGNGTVTVPVSFTGPVPDSDESINVEVFAGAVETNLDGEELTTDNNMNLTGTSVELEKTDITVEDPNLVTADAQGYEDNAIALDINASLADTDGSESMSIMISGVPDGATLSAGTDNGDGTWSLEEGDLNGLTVTPPTDSDVDFDLSVAVTSTEASTGETATVESTFTVEVDAVADTTTVDASYSAEIVETNPSTEPSTIFETSFEDVPDDARVGHPSLDVDGIEGWKPTGDSIEVWDDDMSRDLGSHHDGDNDASDGEKYIELNDVRGFEETSNGLYREVPTEEGKVYQISFDYSGRPGYDENVNSFEFKLDGDQAGTWNHDMSGSDEHDWQTVTVSFVGTGEPMRLEFAENSETDQHYGRGMSLDNLKLVDTGEFENNETHCEVTVDVSATFGDYQDGSEDHFVFVEVPQGWEAESGELVDGADVPGGIAGTTFVRVEVPIDIIEEGEGSIEVPVTFTAPVDVDADIQLNVVAGAQETNLNGEELTDNNNLSLANATVTVAADDMKTPPTPEDPVVVPDDDGPRAGQDSGHGKGTDTQMGKSGSGHGKGQDSKQGKSDSGSGHGKGQKSDKGKSGSGSGHGKGQKSGKGESGSGSGHGKGQKSDKGKSGSGSGHGKGQKSGKGESGSGSGHGKGDSGQGRGVSGSGQGLGIAAAGDDDNNLQGGDIAAAIDKFSNAPAMNDDGNQDMFRNVGASNNGGDQNNWFDEQQEQPMDDEVFGKTDLEQKEEEDQQAKEAEQEEQDTGLQIPVEDTGRNEADFEDRNLV